MFLSVELGPSGGESHFAVRLASRRLIGLIHVFREVYLDYHTVYVYNHSLLAHIAFCH
jgi:hypothetical protein